MLKSLYSKIPISLQNFMVTGYGYLQYKRKFGGLFETEYKNVYDRESFTKNQWSDYQTVEFRRLLKHAFETVPFYNSLYKKHGLNVSILERLELDNLGILPIITKDDVRKYGTTDLLSTKRSKKARFIATSGSSGTPLEIYWSKMMEHRWAASFERRIRNWAGVSRFTKRGMIGGKRVVPEGISTGPYYRYNSYEGQTYFSAYHISPVTAENYIQGITKNQVEYMTGYAMSNFFLADNFKNLGIVPPQMKAVITSSEKLTANMRILLSEVYNCKVYDTYGAVEACCSITENEFGELLESPDVGITEYLDDNYSNHVSNGMIGNIVCTGLLNFDQPLIRYNIGDQAIISADQKTVCGRNFRKISEIIGRQEDVVYGPDKRRLVRFHGIFTGLPELIRSQIIQLDFDKFEILVEVCRQLSQKTRSEIRMRLISQLGDIQMNIIVVDKIPLSPNGKFKAVVSKIRI